MNDARSNPRRRGLITFVLLLVASLGLVTAAVAFDDVPDNAHYAVAVDWGADQGIVNGRTATEFEPGVRVSRGELMVMLWRLAGEPDADPSTFADVPAGSFYETAIGWAQDVGITQGVTATMFEPESPIDRAQLLTQIWNYACQPSEAAPHGFTDVLPGAFYEAAIRWAVAEGIATGYSDTIFGPGLTASRADAITFVWRFAGMPAVGEPGVNRNSDMPGCIGVIDGDEGTPGSPGYTVTGNTQLTVSGGTATASGLATFPASTNLLDNATEPAEGLTVGVTPATGTSAQGSAVEVFADGTFEYQPLAGFRGVDSFGYTVCDTNVTPSCDSSTAYIQVNAPVWYVDEDTGSDTTGDGGSDNAFATLAPLNGAGGAGDPDAAGDTIYVVDPDDTTVAAPIELEGQQSLLGEGVALVQGATTLRAAGDAPTLTATLATAVDVTTDNTIRGVDIDVTGGRGIRTTTTNYGTLTISDVASINTTNNTGVDIEGPGSADVTIGTVTTARGTAVRIGNHAAGTSSFAFSAVNATQDSGHGINIFGLDTPGNGATHTVDLGTVTIDKTGAGNDGIHVLGSLGGPVRVGAGTVAAEATALFVQNAQVDMTFTSLSSNGTNDPTAPGVELQNQHGSITVTGDGANNGNGSGGLIQNKTVDAIDLDRSSSVSLFEVDISTITGQGIDLDRVRSGHVFTGGVFTGVTGAVIDASTSDTPSVITIDSVDIDGGTDGVSAATSGTGSIALTITGSTIDGTTRGIVLDSGSSMEVTLSGNTVGGTTPPTGHELVGVTTNSLCIDPSVANDFSAGTANLTVAASSSLVVVGTDEAAVETANNVAITATGTVTYSSGGCP